MLLPERIQEVARRAPDATAVLAEGRALSYADLDRLSDRYVTWLAGEGVGAGAVVAVTLPRSPHLVAALLGVLKSGAAYLPVDPALPETRRRFLIEDSGAAFTLDSPLPPGVPVNALARPGFVPLAADDLAYVIYTSGSTGTPKGVEITHGALANFLESMREAPGLGAHDRILAHTTISFDIHVLELWLPLTVGASVVLAAQDAARDPASLLALMAREHVTLAQATPALWSMLLASGWRQGTGVKALCGGEALRRDLADALLATGVELWNMYGPTETTVWSACARVAPTGPIVIGEPIARTTLHVLPPDGSASGFDPGAGGELGELCIGGAGLARGYRGRPALTQERFVTPSPGLGRLYRTGDLVRRLPSGAIEYLGRIDQQVKIAGYRVEPGEIEVALRALAGVRDAAVVAVDEGLVSHRLVAYVVAETSGNAAVMREALAATLPAYMVPSQFVFLPRLPLTPSGKVDRKALPAPDVPAQNNGVPPSTPTEALLIELWREVLAVPVAGVTDDFFDLGGHSRLAAHLLALVAQRFGCTLPLPTLVDAPTVRQLARVIDSAAPSGAMRTAPVLALTSAGPDRPTLFLVHAAGGHALIYGPLARALARDVTLLALQSRGFEPAAEPPEAACWPPSVDRLADAYLGDIRRRQPSGPYLLGGASFGGVVAYEIARRLRGAGDEVAMLVLLDSELPRLGLSTLVQQLARLPGFRHWGYPVIRRAYAHGQAIAREGLARYAAWLRRGGMRGLVSPAWAADADAPSGALAEGLVRVRVANEQALADYIPRRYEGSLLFCRARDVTPDAPDTRDEWATFCPRTVYRDVPGTHHTMMLAPQVEALALTLREALAALATPAGSDANRPERPPLPPRHEPVSDPLPRWV